MSVCHMMYDVWKYFNNLLDALIKWNYFWNVRCLYIAVSHEDVLKLVEYEGYWKVLHSYTLLLLVSSSGSWVMFRYKAGLTAGKGTVAEILQNRISAKYMFIALSLEWRPVVKSVAGE